MSSKIKNGAILITTLWIMTILTALCVSVAHRSAIILKLSSYQPDKLKAYNIARAGIFQALALKMLEYERGRSHTIDALNQPWANNTERFKRYAFAEGFYTLSYPIPDKKRVSFRQQENFLYGLSDESSRLNINKAQPQMLARLITQCGVDDDKAEEIAYCIVDWRDKDDNIGREPNFQKMLGAEDEYYQELDNPYPCKNDDFEIVEELLLVKGMSPEIFYGHKDKEGNVTKGLIDFVTVYTKGEVNINTAYEQVLSALLGSDFEDLPQKITAYRRGRDGATGTKDDRWFSTGPYVIERGEEGMVEIKNLIDGDWLGNIYGITTDEYNRIKQLMQKEDVKISTTSNVYRAITEGEVKQVISRIEAVYEFDPEKKTPIVKFWRQE